VSSTGVLTCRVGYVDHTGVINVVKSANPARDVELRQLRLDGVHGHPQVQERGDEHVAGDTRGVRVDEEHLARARACFQGRVARRPRRAVAVTTMFGLGRPRRGAVLLYTRCILCVAAVAVCVTPSVAVAVAVTPPWLWL
jgi:hypothetical protein